MTDAERAELIGWLLKHAAVQAGRLNPIGLTDAMRAYCEGEERLFRRAAAELERLGRRVAELERVRRAEDDVLCAASIAARELEPRGNRCIRALADSLRALSRAEVAITSEGAFKRGEEPDHDCG